MSSKWFCQAYGYTEPVVFGLFMIDLLFIFLFLFRYTRFIVHTVTGCVLYKPAPQKEKPRYTGRDVACIMPTVAPHNTDFVRSCETVLANRPFSLTICTVGAKLKEETEQIVGALKLRERFPDTEKITVVMINKANKRWQVCRGSLEVDSDVAPITVCLDDHVYWKPTFLDSLLAAFEDPRVGFVGTNKRVIRDKEGGLLRSYTNFLACLYLGRHNYQIRSEPYLDGGVFVVSGRTSAIRTEILRSDKFRVPYQNEYFCFGLLGPLNCDDDNFITRWMLRNEWKIKIQYTPDCEIMTPLGEPSNIASLRDAHTWRHYPWSVYAIYITNLVSAAAIWDPLLVWTLMHTSFYLESSKPSLLVALMVVWILASKMVKVTAHFRNHPSDLVWLPAYIAFAYCHSFIKLYCLVTFWNHDWNGRNLDLAEAASVHNLDKTELVAVARPRTLRGITGLYRARKSD
ncbi:hypothetical protein diail_9934 [Diaporthe ilicicola]|nr:hypothetical protein diail_9934 [Diaporthe ilicicola]